jgi:hypothetical protein
VFCRLLGNIMPKESNIDVTARQAPALTKPIEDMSDEELADFVAASQQHALGVSS